MEMIIKTKYNIDQEVFVIDGVNITSYKVDKIVISGDSHYYNLCNNKRGGIIIDSVFEKDVFETKEEAKNELIRRINNS